MEKQEASNTTTTITTSYQLKLQCGTQIRQFNLEQNRDSCARLQDFIVQSFDIKDFKLIVPGTNAIIPCEQLLEMLKVRNSVDGNPFDIRVEPSVLLSKVDGKIQRLESKAADLQAKILKLKAQPMKRQPRQPNGKRNKGFCTKKALRKGPRLGKMSKELAARWDNKKIERAASFQSVPPNTAFAREWILKNVGQQPWPIGTVLKRQQTPKNAKPIPGAPEDMTLPKEGIPPGESIQLPLNFTSPLQEGIYVCFWRLTTPQNQYLGPRVRVRVNVQSLETKSDEDSPLVEPIDIHQGLDEIQMQTD